MSGINGITNSLLSATNENNLQLASLNFDFTLLKFEAPPEYQRLGSLLSADRKKDAEEGPVHVTARRLGALFEELVPRAPLLVKAFGTRVSEVVETPGISPQGSILHGPFERYVGADGTALWAAATSGFASIAICLLACLLARTWDAKHATALWVELVDQRKREIEKAFEETSLVSPAALFSARQGISRYELAQWDNSARSWLRSADKAKAFEVTQFSLIQRNIDLPLPSHSTTYVNIVHVWKQAMQGLEALLSGTPLLVSDGTFLLAFSSWHLFPDLIVLGQETKNASFRDKLFPPGGKATIGAEPTSARSPFGGLQWSLAFSHLKFYGDPVLARNDRDFTRVTFHELRLVVLGSLLNSWRVSVRDHPSIAQWFLDIWSLLGTVPNARDNLPWMEHLVEAAQALLSTDDREKEKNSQLVQYGQRRGKSFLVDRSDSVLAPFFGLGNPLTAKALSERTDRDCGVEYLRSMARALGLRDSSTLICYNLAKRRSNDGSSPTSYVEIATAFPCMQESRKRGADGEVLNYPAHARWLLASSTSHSSGDFLAHEAMMSKACAAIGERFSSLVSKFGVELNERFSWTDPPAPFGRKGQTSQHSYHLVFGNQRLGLYTETPMDNDLQQVQLQAEGLATQSPSPRVALQNYARASLSPVLLADYFAALVDKGTRKRLSSSRDTFELRYERHAPGVQFSTSPCKFPINLCKSLFAFSLAADVYKNIEGATIPLKVVSKPLYECLWLPSPFYLESQAKDLSDVDVRFNYSEPAFIPAQPQPLDLPQAFSCIARFESGACDVDPADLEPALALASGDSIFVAAAVLSDPFDRPEPHLIRRIVGNIGRPGISVLVAPQDPKIRKPTESFNIIAHAPYDFCREDNFRSTSLHLSFTEWTFPLYAEDERTIDQDVMMVESVISVLDRGRWVADLDIRGIDFEGLPRITTAPCQGHGPIAPCPHQDHLPPVADDVAHRDYFSVDNWDELLDAPEGSGIVRAHGNWAARLAAVSILSQQGQGHSIGVFGPERVCFQCYQAEQSHMDVDVFEEREAPLPSFCID
ncbi:hypothetical protein BO86DRAFT_390602 [Aspergillus japonicus CBS 114.51]|uniref:Uncharacterized protein n=1 Tax=Aspergillus japonicus CBS 114.51 TaxID=1448312 RepID=A0A8T8WVW2_ASPJA|nr:hypothetical protein BO86DRAFT_390602 [Aspergillus japonicus CBS 114.51]RAH79976.1 hypothetical protein BO86DRAFT_390602 [Aspergillus japonicus CBS 114.51]